MNETDLASVHLMFSIPRSSSHTRLPSMICAAFTLRTTSTSCRESAPPICKASPRALMPSTWATTGEGRSGIFNASHFEENA